MRDSKSPDNPRKVLLIGPNFYWYLESATQKYTDKGCNTRMVMDNEIIYPRQVFRRLAFTLGFGNCIRKMETERFNKEILRCFNEFEPDEVVVQYPCWITTDTLAFLKNHSYVLMNLNDTTIIHPEIISVLPYAHRITTYEKVDYTKIREMGYDIEFVEGSCDTTLFYPIDVEKDIDVCFIGAMYSGRRKLLERLAYDLPDVNFAFYGRYAPISKPKEYFKWRFDARLHQCFKNRVTQQKETNLLYNKAKIVLNIHSSQNVEGWSARLPEIAATNSFQLVDYKKCIEDEFGEKIVTCKSYDELVEKIRYYLPHDEEREAIAEAAYLYVQEKFG